MSRSSTTKPGTACTALLASHGAEKSAILPQTRHTRCWCGTRFASNRVPPAVVLTRRMSFSRSSDSRIRYTVARDRDGICDCREAYTASTVGCEGSAARAL
ncbi:MAG: hypothetical protein A2X53_22335 [Candidatus Rokubacteria bacterium GWA2_70_23]|nr:MAG: hypothetical protein A2X53_22335 [Candidatus Rokubacteria bacterium GWA2_70_23]